MEIRSRSRRNYSGKIAFKHSAIFPEKLAQDHILSWSSEGNLVFDPMCGSGTTCKMAFLSNRKYLGVDISEEYIHIAKTRLREAQKERQPEWFFVSDKNRRCTSGCTRMNGWVVCRQSKGYLVKNGIQENLETNFDKGSVGLIREDRGDNFLVWLIGNDNKYIRLV